MRSQNARWTTGQKLIQSFLRGRHYQGLCGYGDFFLAYFTHTHDRHDLTLGADLELIGQSIGSDSRMALPRLRNRTCRPQPQTRRDRTGLSAWRIGLKRRSFVRAQTVGAVFWTNQQNKSRLSGPVSRHFQCVSSPAWAVTNGQRHQKHITLT
jgi:hypothetical protein